MHITEAHNIIDIWLIGFWSKRDPIGKSLHLFDSDRSVLPSAENLQVDLPDIYEWKGWSLPRSGVLLFPVAYNSCLLKIPLYAIQKFCINIFLASCAINPILIVCSLSYWYFFGCNPTFNTTPIPLNRLTMEESP